MPNNKIPPPSTRKSKKKGQSSNHVFTHIKELVCSNAVSSTALTFTTDGSGACSANSIMVPVGLATAPLSGATFGSAASIYQPPLRWLYDTSSRFRYYRVLSATLIFVGNVGSTATGRVVVMTSRDVLDTQQSPQQAYVTGENSKTFDLANSASREIRIPMDIDSNWKKVSAILGLAATVPPILAPGAAGFLVPYNTVNDLAFSAFSAIAFNAPASTNLGSFFLEYNVEFKGPISAIVNV